MRKVSLLFCIAILFTLSACQSKSNQPRESQSPSSTQVSQPSGPWKMSLTTDPPQPVSGADTTFRVTMTSQAGASVDSADIQVALKMRTMDMGKNLVKLADTGDGVYEGKGRFSMAGPWDVVVNARKDAETGTQTFPVVVKK